MNDIRQPESSWSFTIEETLKVLDLDQEKGLSADVVKQRREAFGPNKIRQSHAKPVWRILLEQFANLIMLVLALAAVLSFAFSQWIDGIAIIIAIFINVLVGFITEWRATRSMEALQQMEKITATVRRGGEEHEVSASELVPGDVIVLESGMMVPADIRLTEASNLQTNESPLTGESTPVSKQTESLAEDTPLAERSNMLYKGTSVTRGSGYGVAVSTGMDTEIGAIASLVDEAEAKSDPLEKQLNSLTRSLIKIIFVVSVLAGVMGILSGKDVFLMIKTVVVLIVAAVPEGLPVVATVALVRGMKQMADQNALVRRLNAVQTLGSTNVIFTDKTGTLTENQMTLTELRQPDETIEISGEGLSPEGDFFAGEQEIDPEENSILMEALTSGVLCSNASFRTDEEGEPDSVGDPMEVALLVAGEKAGIKQDRLLEKYPETREVAFDPATKMMATFHKSDDKGFRVSVKGAPEALLESCTGVKHKEKTEELTEEQRSNWLEQNSKMAEKGLRVLALAVKHADSDEEEPYENLEFLGLAGLFDPPRGDLASDIEKCFAAGLRVIMLTGDQKATAVKVADAVGMIEDGEGKVRYGSDLENISSLSEEEAEKLTQTPIFCRVSPEQKLKLISVYQERKNIVAMTGDGVNDAPALKKSDIGIAMGERGQQVAKEAADIILQDDDFSTILTAVEHGRTIFNNIRKFVIYLISGNLGEILIVTLAAVAGLPLPLLPLQILYLNAINDVFPALALGMGKSEEDVMEKPPRDPDEPIMGKPQWIETIGYGLLIAVAVLTGFLLALYRFDLGKEGAVTVSFLSLALGRLWHVFNMRDAGSCIFRNTVIKNPYVVGSLVLCTGLILLALYVPILSEALNISMPGKTGWLLLLLTSLVPLVLGQIALKLQQMFKKG